MIDEVSVSTLPAVTFTSEGKDPIFGDTPDANNEKREVLDILDTPRVIVVRVDGMQCRVQLQKFCRWGTVTIILNKHERQSLSYIVFWAQIQERGRATLCLFGAWSAVRY